MAMLLTLKGTPFIYQGQEIGMKNGEFKSMDDYKDPETHRIEALMHKLHFPKKLRMGLIHKTSRDHARMPIPWTIEGGFSLTKPWIQMNDRMNNINVEDQKKDQNSIWNQTKTLIQIRKSHPVLSYGSFDVKYHRHGLFIYQRQLKEQKTMIVINLTDKKRKNPCQLKGQLLWTNQSTYESMEVINPYQAIIMVEN